MRKPRGFVFNVIDHAIEIKLTKNCIADCSHIGDVGYEVRNWVDKLMPYLDKLPEDKVRLWLKPTGYDEGDLKDHEANLGRLVWLAACDCKEYKTCWAYFDGN